MSRERRQDRVYRAALLAFLAALVGAGLAGVPAPLVVLGGIAFAALAILAVHVAGRRAAAPRGQGRSHPVPHPRQGLEFR